MKTRSLNRLLVVGLATISLALTTGLTGASAAGPETTDIGILNTCDPSGNGPNESKTRSEILSRAQRWVNLGITYNAGACHVDSYGKYRRDCSGLLAMAWGLEINLVSDSSAGSSDNYMSYAAAGNGMYFISRSQLQPGDGLVRSGHVELFSHWVDPAHPDTSAAYVYSFNSTGETVQNPYAVTNFGNLGRNSSADMGSFRYVRYKGIVGGTGAVKLNDYNRDGVSDLVAVNSAGTIHVWTGTGTGGFNASYTIGSGWNAYHDLTAVGDINRDGVGDLVGFDAAGTIHVWTGTGTGGFNASYTIGSGWDSYQRLTGVGDINRDGVGDLVGINSAGTIHVWTGTGTGGFNSPYTIGSGWNAYHDLTGLGDLNRDGVGDLVGIDAGGTIFVWTGTGTGGFNASYTIGSGWNAFHDLT